MFNEKFITQLGTKNAPHIKIFNSKPSREETSLDILNSLNCKFFTIDRFDNLYIRIDVPINQFRLKGGEVDRFY